MTAYLLTLLTRNKLDLEEKLIASLGLKCIIGSEWYSIKTAYNDHPAYICEKNWYAINFLASSRISSKPPNPSQNIPSEHRNNTPWKPYGKCSVIAFNDIL